MKPKENQDVTGLILAGGQATRMGGQDKGLIEFKGRPLVAWAIERLGPQVGTLLVNANRNSEIYEGFGFPVLADVILDYPGPLAGLHAGLGACTTPLLACVPCDSPFLPLDLVSRLREAMQRENADAATVRSDEGLQPVFSLVHRKLAPGLATYLAAGRRNIRDWLHCNRLAIVDFPDATAFANINTPQDLLQETGKNGQTR